jgi:hypothetical protein
MPLKQEYKKIIFLHKIQNHVKKSKVAVAYKSVALRVLAVVTVSAFSVRT